MQVYGKVIARYRGRGRLFLRAETPLPCQVNIAQRSDGVIFVECQATGARTLTINPDRADAKSIILEADAGRVSVSRLFGPTRYDFQSRQRGPGLSHRMKLIYYANQMDISYGQVNASASHAHFGVLNFEYLGNAPQHAGTSTFLGALRVPLASGEVLLERVAGYEETIKRLKAVGGTDLTCHAMMPLSSRVSISHAVRDMEDLCALLSLARGTKINWAYFDILSETGAKLHTRHVSRVTKRFMPFPLIDPHEPDDLLSLLSCFHRFQEVEEAHSLKQVVDHYTDAKLQGPFLEARAMLAATLVDFLVGRYRQKTNRHCVHKDFGKRFAQRRLRKGLRELLDSALPDVTDSQKDQFLGNLQQLNRPAFARVLKEFTESLSLQVSRTEIQRIARIRNSLVHNASFLDDSENWTQYVQLINLLDRILLGILDYEGYYLDCTRNWQRTEFCRSQPDDEHRC